MNRVLVAGCGFLGTELALQLVAGGHEVWGLRRNTDALPPGIGRISADLADPRQLAELPDRLDAVVYAATSDGSGEDSYRATYVDGLRNLLNAVAPRESAPRLVFVSSTGVYGQTDGSWVDEDSPTEPRDATGRILLEAERIALAAPFRSIVLRLGGLYGPRRNRLIERVRKGEATISSGSPVYSNRIHRDDAAAAIRHLLALDDPAPLYVGVDHEPAEESVVLRWLAEQLGVAAPPVSASPTLSRRSNKRCRNARLVRSGYTFRFPTFREGYANVLGFLRDTTVVPGAA